ncbi:L-rhamnose-binding lectin SML-like [Odontesthes bonariensis]
MLHFRLSIGLLLATACLLMASVASTERVISCDDNFNVHRLSCDTGVISVQSALYGRADRETCSEGITQQQLDNTRCSQEGTVDVIKNRCDGKKVCEIRTTVVHTSDPCRGIFKYLDTNYTCLPAIHLVTCEHSIAHLQCDEGQVIFVYGADYGRYDQTTCSYKRPASQTENVYCSNPTRRVAERCNGKNRCIIRARNSVFGDPCAGTFKYLEVAYVCECKLFKSLCNILDLFHSSLWKHTEMTNMH